MFTRFKMRLTLNRIKKIKFTSDENVIQSFDNNILESLAALDCIELYYADNQIYSLAYTSQGTLYLLGRSELWINRIGGFISGFATSVVAKLILDWIL